MCVCVFKEKKEKYLALQRHRDSRDLHENMMGDVECTKYDMIVSFKALEDKSIGLRSRKDHVNDKLSGG